MLASDSARRFILLALGGIAAAQAVAAVLFTFAGNWWGMAPATKVGLIDLLLLLCAAAAALAAPGSFARSLWAASGAVLSGVLFGVHGQIWQTGADAWQLFALWTGLAVLWAVVAESDACWAVAAGLGMVGLYLWADTAAPSSLLPDQWQIWVVAVPPAVAAAASHALGRRGSWLKPVLLAAAAGALGWGGIASLIDHDSVPSALSLLAGLLAMAAAPPRRSGPWPFAIGLILAVVMAEAFAIKLSLDVGDHLSSSYSAIVSMLVIAALVLAGAAAVGVVLRRLFADKLGRLAPQMELALSVATGLGAWTAAVMACAAVGGLTALVASEHEAGLVVAVVAAGIFIVLRLIWRQPGTFGRHVQAAFAVAAYGAVLGHMAVNDMELAAVTAVAVVLLVPLALLAPTVPAGLAGAVTALTLCAVLADRQSHDHVLALGAVAAAAGWLVLRFNLPAMRAVAVVLVLGAFVIPAALEFAHGGMALPARIVAAVTAAALVGALLWRRRDLCTRSLVAASVLVLGGSLVVPAGAAAVVGLLAVSVRAVGRPLVVLAFVFAAWSLSRFYYLLEIPLMQKAAWLAIGAAVTLVAWLAAGGRVKLRLAAGRATVLLLAAALVPMVLQGYDARAKLAIVAEGRQVFLPLYPVDPRSLFQGDYMDLRYSPRLTDALPAAGGAVALRLDERGVASASRVADGTLEADEIVVQAHGGRYRGTLAPDSFMFEEGTGRDWSRARFAEVRVANGKLVLVGLAGPDLAPIMPTSPTGVQ